VLRLHNHGTQPVRAVRVAVSHPGFFARPPGGAWAWGPGGGPAEAWIAAEAMAGGRAEAAWEGGVVMDLAAGPGDGDGPGRGGRVVTDVAGAGPGAGGVVADPAAGAGGGVHQDLAGAGARSGVARADGAAGPGDAAAVWAAGGLGAGESRDVELLCCAAMEGRHCLRVLVHYHGDGDEVLMYPDPDAGPAQVRGGAGQARASKVGASEVGRLAAACHCMQVTLHPPLFFPLSFSLLSPPLISSPLPSLPFPSVFRVS
jgi:hypothetical protein